MSKGDPPAIAISRLIGFPAYLDNENTSKFYRQKDKEDEYNKAYRNERKSLNPYMREYYNATQKAMQEKMK